MRAAARAGQPAALPSRLRRRADSTVGTSLAPWGLSFIQSYAVDKKLAVDDLRYERLDVIIGSVLTGVIGFFVVVTCAATLRVRGVQVDSAADAAALAPLAGSFARSLFAIGIIGAAILASAVLPLSTAYFLSEFTGQEGALDDGSAVLRSSTAVVWVWRGWLW